MTTRPVEFTINVKLLCPNCGQPMWKPLEEIQNQKRIFCAYVCHKSFDVELPKITFSYDNIIYPEIDIETLKSLNLDDIKWLDFDFSKIKNILKLQGFNKTEINKMISTAMKYGESFEGKSESEILKKVLSCYARIG